MSKQTKIPVKVKGSKKRKIPYKQIKTSQSKLDYSKDIIRVSNQIASCIEINNISRKDFYNDIINLKQENISEKDFISKYPELFNGKIAKFKNSKTFLGSYRRNINPKYFEQLDDKYKDFNQELREFTYIKVEKEKEKEKEKKEKEYPYVNPKDVNTKYHKFYKQIDYKNIVFGFEQKTDFIYRFKQSKQLKKMISNKEINYDISIGNFESEILLKLDLDLSILLQYFEQYYKIDILRFGIGFSFDYEVCELNGKHYKIDTFGCKTSVNRKDYLLFSEIGKKYDFLKEFFRNMMRSKQYYIYISRIFLTFYTEQNTYFDF